MILPKITYQHQQPVYATEFDACCDVKSSAALSILPGQRALIPTGLYLSPLSRFQRFILRLIPFSFMLRILPRSGASVKGVDIGAGVVDIAYTQEIKVLLINNTRDTLNVRYGDRIAQMTWIVGLKVSGASITDRRREGGFGSTGG